MSSLKLVEGKQRKPALIYVAGPEWQSVFSRRDTLEPSFVDLHSSCWLFHAKDDGGDKPVFANYAAILYLRSLKSTSSTTIS